MRRKQTALLMTVLILSSLAFVSQTRPQAPVENTNPGEAAAGGPPVTDEDGERIPLEVKVGDVVLFPAFSGREITYQDEPHLIISDTEVLAVSQEA
mgnify:CR=1 FL=1